MVKAKYKPFHKLLKIALQDSDFKVDALNENSARLQSSGQYEDLRVNLENLLKSHLIDVKSVKVYLYGSRIVGLANNTSDLDIFIEIDDNFNSTKNDDRDQKVIWNVEKILSQTSEGRQLWDVKICIDDTKVPVIQARYKPHNLQCDITVSNGLGVKNTMMMRYLFDLQPEAMRLFHFVRMILPEINDKIDGYFLKVLVVVFLQVKGYLPSVQQVQANLVQQTIDGWSVQLNESRDLTFYGINKMSSYKCCITPFFRFYGKVHGIVFSANQGKTIKKRKYKLKDAIADDPAFCVIGLLDQSYNVGKRLNYDQYWFFTGTCASVYDGYLSRLGL